MSYKPGDTVRTAFTTQRYGTGVVTAADSTPTAILIRNGVVDTTGIVLTVTSVATGVYTVSCVLTPLSGGAYAAGDAIQIVASATVNSVAGSAKIFDCVLDGYRLSDSPPAVATLQTVDQQYIATGTAQAGGSTSITLASGSNANNDFYKGCGVRIYGGTGAGQRENLITAYDGATKVATVLNAWTTNPDSTSTYAIGSRRLHAVDGNLSVTAATVTANVNANVVKVNGSDATTATPAPTVAEIAAGVLSNPSNLILTNSSGQVSLNLTQSVPTTGNTAHTVGDALNAARAQGFGKWTIVGTTLTLYASDDTTVVKTFSLDSASSPTSRT